MTSRGAAASKIKAIAPRPPTSQVGWPGRSNISIFACCLRLLDVDLRDDWPGIVHATFTTKTAQQHVQHKVKAVEWSLYRLFELYDGEETRDKLRPFFPPNTPLQSLNLRAALYRCLTELKKNGILKGHIQLRKTMLDECKGDKFEEVLSSFAMIVLRKVVQKTHASILEKNSGLDVRTIPPLILAYRVSLSSAIRERNHLKQDMERFLEDINKAKDELTRRKKDIVTGQVEPDPTLRRAMSDLVNSNWVGNQAWADLILEGLPPQSALGQFDHGDVSGEKMPAEKDRATSKLLNNLDDRIQQHRTRLAEWRLISKDLAAADAGPTTAKAKLEESLEVPAPQAARFRQHKQIDLNSARQAQDGQRFIHGVYKDLLGSMQIELGAVSVGRNKKGPVSQDRYVSTKPWGLRDLSLETKLGENLGEIHSFASDLATDLPVRPLSPPTWVGQSVLPTSSPSRMKWPNSEILSPASADETAQLEAFSPPLETPSHTKLLGINPIPFSADRLKMETSPVVDSSPISSIHDESFTTGWMAQPTSGPTAVKVSERIPSPESRQLWNNESPASPSKEWMNLIDRTRASMSNFGNYRHPLDMERDTDELETPRPHKQLVNARPVTEEEEDPNRHNRRTTLAERTRQSMSLFSASKPQSTAHERRKSQHHRHQRLSQFFPVNQFETPGKPAHRRMSEFGPSSESSTPREKLFEEEADYASVFKSRPKIAMSPIISPEHDGEEEGVGYDSILEQDMEGLQLASDDEYD